MHGPLPESSWKRQRQAQKARGLQCLRQDPADKGKENRKVMTTRNDRTKLQGRVALAAVLALCPFQRPGLPARWTDAQGKRTRPTLSLSTLPPRRAPLRAVPRQGRKARRHGPRRNTRYAISPTHSPIRLRGPLLPVMALRLTQFRRVPLPRLLGIPMVPTLTSKSLPQAAPPDTRRMAQRPSRCAGSGSGAHVAHGPSFNRLPAGDQQRLVSSCTRSIRCLRAARPPPRP